MAAYADVRYEVGPQEDPFTIGNKHDGHNVLHVSSKHNSKDVLKEYDLATNNHTKKSNSVETEYEGYYLKKLDALRIGDKPDWTRVGRTKIPFSNAQLLGVIKGQRRKTGKGALRAFEDLSRAQQAVVNRLVETKQASEKNSNAIWNLACVRRDIEKNIRTRARETKKILVILKREPKNTIRPGFIGERGTAIYREADVIDLLADPLPVKNKSKDKNLQNGGTFDEHEQGAGVDFVALDSLLGVKKTSKNKNKFDNHVNIRPVSDDADDIPYDVPIYRDPFAGITANNNNNIPIPPAHHNTRLTDFQTQDQQYSQQHDVQPYEHQNQYQQPQPQPIHVNDWAAQQQQQQQQPHHQRPVAPEPPSYTNHNQYPPHEPHYSLQDHQAALPYENNPFQPNHEFNQHGSFDFPPKYNDPRFSTPSPAEDLQRHKRSLSARRYTKDIAPPGAEDPVFLEKVTNWKISSNQQHQQHRRPSPSSEDDSYRDEVFSRGDSRRSFTPPSSPPRSDDYDYDHDEVYRARSRRQKRYHADERGGDIFVVSSVQRRRGSSPTRYLTEGGGRRGRRDVMDYPLGGGAVVERRKPGGRYEQDTVVEYVRGGGRRGEGRRRGEEVLVRHRDDRDRRDRSRRRTSGYW